VILRAALLVLAAAVAVPPVAAQDEGQSEWLGYAHLYFGIAQTHGTNVSGDVSYDVDSRSGDLEWTTGLMTGAWKGRWGGQVEFNWMTVEYSDVVYSGSTVTYTGALDISNLFVEADAFFRALGSDAKGLDIVAGVRSYRMSNSYSLTRTDTQFGQVQDGNSVSQSWVDPLIAVRFVGNTDEQFWGSIRAEVGGFDVGSELMWGIRAQAGLRWGQTDWSLGIRHYDIKYDNGKEGDEFFSHDARHNQFLFLIGYRFE
jgi:hypothetical protein